MHVSDEMLRKMVQVYRDSIGGIEESFAAVLAVLPEMYTVEQVCEMYGSWILSNEKDACMTFPEYISPRLTQQTPAAQLVGAEVNGDLLYDSEQATPDAEPIITLAEHKAKMLDLLHECAPATEGTALYEKWLRQFDLAKPTPEERVTIGTVVGSEFYSLYFIDDKIVSDEQIKAALVAQLKKEEK